RSVNASRAAKPSRLRSASFASWSWIPAIVAAVGSSAYRSRTNASSCCRNAGSSPTIEASLSGRVHAWGVGHGRGRAVSRLHGLRSAVLPASVHGERRWLVQAVRHPPHLPGGRHGRARRRMGSPARRAPADDRVRRVRRQEAPVRHLQLPARALPHLRLPRRRSRRVAGPRALRPRAPSQARAGALAGVTHTRASVIKRVEAEYRALDRIVRQLRPADLRKPAMRRALRAAPPAYFARRWAAQWPFDAIGHVAEHRRKHLEPLVEATRRAR